MAGGGPGDPGDSLKRVVIVGGGYAGLFAARRASGGTRGGVGVEVTLVDPAPEWVERTRLHQVAVGDGSVRRWPLAELFRGTGVRVVGGRVTEIDPGGGGVAVETASGTTQHLPFDRLVYALGSTADAGPVPGAREHAFVLDSVATSEDLRRALDYASSSDAPGGRVAVVGGGLTGVEAATEIAERYPALSVSLVTAGEIGGGLSARGREYLLKAVWRLGVGLRERTRVGEVGRGALKTADGEEVPADVVVWATGFAVPDLARRSGLATDGRGRVLVDASLRSVSHPNVFAGGDSARPTESVGAGAVRPSAYTSTIMGAHAGANVSRDLAGKPAKPLRFGYLVQSVSLGRRDGLAQFTDGNDRPFGWVVTGRAAARIKESIERFVVVGFLRLERLLPGTYAWRPAPGSRGGSVEGPAGKA